MAIPFADVTFESNPGNNQRQPAEVLIRQKEYLHDVAIITIDLDRGGAKKYSKGSPVTIDWGWLPSDIETFLGYISHTKTVETSEGPPQLKVFCVGASYSMNQRHQRSFQKMLVGSIIGKLAAAHHMSLLADPSSRYHLHIPQLGQSDWNLGVRLAKDIGFTFGARQTTVLFKRRLIDTRPGRQPLFRLTPGLYTERGAVYTVVHNAGSAPLAAREIVQVDGLDDNGNLLTMVDTGDPNDPVKPVFTRFNPPQEEILSVRSIQEGKDLLSGLSQMNRFYVQAAAELSGDPRVRPGMTVALADVGQDVDGYWWTGSVDHIIAPASYTMKTQLGRETVQQTQYAPAPSSDSGRPEIYPSDPGVEFVTEPDPDSIFNPLDACIPVEELVSDAFGSVTSTTPDPFASAARQELRNRRPRPARRRGVAPGVGAAQAAPRLHGWRAVTTTSKFTS